MRYLPPYLKFVFTITTDSPMKTSYISKLLQLKTTNYDYLNEEELFAQYNASMTELIGNHKTQDKINVDTLKEICMDSFERLLEYYELIYFLDASHASVAQAVASIRQFVSTRVEELEEEDKDMALNILSYLSRIRMPIEIELFASIIKHPVEKITMLIKDKLSHDVLMFQDEQITLTPAASPNNEESKEELDMETEMKKDGLLKTYLTLRTTPREVKPPKIDPDSPEDKQVHNEIVLHFIKHSIKAHEQEDQYRNVNDYFKFCLFTHMAKSDRDFSGDVDAALGKKADFLDPVEDDDEPQKDEPKEAESVSGEVKTRSFFEIYDLLFKSKSLYHYIEYHKSFECLRNDIVLIQASEFTKISDDEKDQLLNLNNILFLTE